MNAEAETRFELEVATLTDVGTEREHNEDHCGELLESSACGLLVVADGVSSAEAGETASQTAVAVTLKAFGEQPSGMATSKRLYRAVQQANIEVYDLATVVPELRGMTTTLTAVVVDRGELTAAHIGDSRLYLLRDGRLTQLTKDHTVAGEKARMGLMSKARAREHPDRSVLTRSLGRELIVPIDRISNRLFRGDALLVCSDGLYNVLDEEQMAPLLLAGGRRRGLSPPDRHRQRPRDARQRERRRAPGAERPRTVRSPRRPRREASGPLHPTRRLKLRPASRKDPAARSIGEVAEWPKAPDSKSGLGASPTWVRLPPSPR